MEDKWTRLEKTAVHEMGHVVACIAMYRKPPRSVIIWPSGNGEVKWEFPIMSNWYDAIILSAGTAAVSIMTSVGGTVKIKVVRANKHDFADLRATGIDPELAMWAAIEIVVGNKALIEEHWSWFLPRPDTQYRLVKGRDLTWMVGMVQ